MIRLRLLGPLALEHEDGTAIRSVLAQPKRLALLAYLAVPHPPSRRSRDELVGLFWPERDDEHARTNLRQTLYRVRRSLGKGVLVGKGRERVGADPDRLWCDAAAFTAAVEDARSEDALELYRGAFLEGFHLEGAPEFERWVDRERRRLRLQAVDAAWDLTDRTMERGDPDAARRWADRALRLAPYDGRALRRYLALMDRLGQPASAVRAYEAYAARLQEDLELEPAPETRALIEQVRRRSSGGDRSRDQEKEIEHDDGHPSPIRPGEPRTTRTEQNQGENRGPVSASTRTDAIADRAGIGAEFGNLSRRTVLLAALLGLLLLGYGGYTLLGANGGAEETRRIRSLAVLPFDDFSRNRAPDYFAAGMHDALITELGKIGALAVTSRSSAARFSGSEASIPEIAEVLKVDAVVEGSVLRAGDDVRITLQLVHGSTDRQLWAASFQREMRNVLALQREVARTIAEEIQVAVAPAEESQLESAPVIEPEAYTQYLRGNHALTMGTEAAFQQALDHYRRAIAIDSSYASPYAGLAMAYIELGSWMASLPPSAVHPHARAAALEALERDSTLAEAHIALGRVRHLFEWDWSGAEAAFRRGMELNPGSSHALWIYGNYLTSMGRFEEAVAVGRRLVQRDPLSAPAYGLLGWALEYLGRNEEALEQYRAALAVPRHPWDPDLNLAEFYLKRGQPDSAYSFLTRAEEAIGEDASPTLVALFGHGYGRAGRPGDARRILKILGARSEEKYVPPNALAVVHMGLGQEREALALLERGFEIRDVTSVWHKVRWVWDPLRDEPRFRELLRRMDFPDS